jgi:hypothetical protein
MHELLRPGGVLSLNFVGYRRVRYGLATAGRQRPDRNAARRAPQPEHAYALRDEHRSAQRAECCPSGIFAVGGGKTRERQVCNHSEFQRPRQESNLRPTL